MFSRLIPVCHSSFFLSLNWGGSEDRKTRAMRSYQKGGAVRSTIWVFMSPEPSYQPCCSPILQSFSWKHCSTSNPSFHHSEGNMDPEFRQILQTTVNRCRSISKFSRWAERLKPERAKNLDPALNGRYRHRERCIFLKPKRRSSTSQ